MQTPTLFLNARDEFEKIRKASYKKYIFYQFFGKTLITASIVLGIIISFSPKLELSLDNISIVGALSTILPSIYQTFNVQKLANHSNIMRKKASSIKREIEHKIEEFKIFFRGIDNAPIPEEYSTHQIINYINSKYKEIDDMDLGYLMEGSYERMITERES